MEKIVYQKPGFDPRYMMLSLTEENGSDYFDDTPPLWTKSDRRSAWEEEPRALTLPVLRQVH